MTNAVIFDFDGLLVDTETISYKVYKKILSEYGYEFSIEDYAQNYCGKIEIKNVANLIATYDLPCTVKAGLEKYIIFENELLSKGVDLKRGARELLCYLKENQYKTAIASSSIKVRAMNILNQHGIVRYFDEFVFGDEVEHGKPSPDIFLKACEKLGETPEKCLVLEDSEAGIQAAYAANIPVICIPDLKMPEKQFLDKAAAVRGALDEVIMYLSKEAE